MRSISINFAEISFMFSNKISCLKLSHPYFLIAFHIVIEESLLYPNPSFRHRVLTDLDVIPIYTLPDGETCL